MTKKSCSEIEQRVGEVRRRIEDAARKAGRSVEEITLIGVTKTRTAEEVRQLICAGVATIGENRVQELLEKQPHLQDLEYKAHLIGHLQRNKAKFLPGKIDMLQSLSSEETVQALEKAYAQHDERLNVLIEVNIGQEESKSGIDKEGLERLVQRVMQSPVLCLKGLMAIPPFGLGEEIRRYFEQMYNLFIDIRAKTRDNVNVLSMGMSSDFEYAILEGATMVRVGTDLFGARNYA